MLAIHRRTKQTGRILGIEKQTIKMLFELIIGVMVLAISLWQYFSMGAAVWYVVWYLDVLAVQRDICMHGHLQMCIILLLPFLFRFATTVMNDHYCCMVGRRE
eukprot:GHVL01033156.1.p1 GENE.GHVL01033156.1~~GHVL01033156.1.p1  ORF type:complete len:103 (+),score=3.27 GHVL01033156.1:1128-1436(+)